jgi:hypothetical protein
MNGPPAARKETGLKKREHIGNMRALSGALSCVARPRAALM